MKSYLKFGLLLVGLSLLLWQCQKDNFIENVQTEIAESIFKTNTVKLSDIPDVKDFLTLKSKTNIFSQKTIIDGAIFDQDNIMEVIDTLNRTNYSFRFTYANTPKGVYYNLVVGKSPEGVLKAPYVLKYVTDSTYTDAFIENKYDFRFFKGTVGLHKFTDYFQQGGAFKTDGDTFCPPEYDANGDPIACDNLNLDGSGVGSGGGGSGSDGGIAPSGDGTTNGGGTFGDSGTGGYGISVSWVCNAYGIEHPSPSDCCCSDQGGTWIINLNLSFNKSSSQNRTATDCPSCPTDSGGGVGVSLGFENTIDDHCPDLKNLLDSTKSNVKPSLENLKTTVDQDGENGVSFKKEGATYSDTNLTPTSTTTIGIPTGGNNYAGAHSHPSLTTFPMFSWSDIYTLFNLHNRANIDVKNEVTLFLASKNQFLNTQVDIYALRINDFTAFRNKINQVLNDIVKEDPKLDITATINERLNALNEKLGRKYKATGDNRQEKAFLDFFNKYDISLFKANDAIDNWSELDATTFTLNASGITETPCN